MYSTGGSSDRDRISATRPILSPNAFAIAMICANVCFAVAGLSAAYLLLGLFTGHLSDFTTLALQADRERILSNLGLGRQVFVVSAALGAIFMGVAFLTEEAAGYILLLGSLVVGFGIPMAFAQFGGAGFAPDKNAALRLSLGAFPAAALFPGVVAGLMIARDVAVRFLSAMQPVERHISEEEMRFGGGVKKQVASATHRPSPLPGKCWEGGYCRETIKVHCPVFVSKTPCWKQKRGCYCEESIVAEAASRINGMHLPMAGAGTGRFNFTGDAALQVGVAAPKVSRSLTDAQKRERCRQCVIYNEHQQKKYNLLMPVTIAATIVVWALLLTVLRGQVDHSFAVTLALIDKLSFTPGSGPMHQARLGATDASPFIIWPVLIALGIMLLAKMLQTLEWALFKLKI